MRVNVTFGAAVDPFSMEHDFILRQLADSIYDYCGLDYTDNLYSLASKIQQRVAQLKLSNMDYLHHVRSHPEEWDTLIELITINETYFFREEAQLNELIYKVLPALANQSVIRIWSAACSTGEEPYSIAMLIAESGVIPLSKVEIYATDINKRVLDFARRGIYGKNSMCFRRTPQDMLDKYFTLSEQGYVLQDWIKDRVSFYHTNLVKSQGTVPPVPHVDIILCRNVLIYFDSATIRTVVHHLSNKLVAGGYLFLGHAETISGMLPDLSTVNAASTFYYRKGGKPEWNSSVF